MSLSSCDIPYSQRRGQHPPKKKKLDTECARTLPRSVKFEWNHGSPFLWAISWINGCRVDCLQYPVRQVSESVPVNEVKRPPTEKVDLHIM